MGVTNRRIERTKSDFFRELCKLVATEELRDRISFAKYRESLDASTVVAVRLGRVGATVNSKNDVFRSNKTTVVGGLSGIRPGPSAAAPPPSATAPVIEHVEAHVHNRSGAAAK